MRNEETSTYRSVSLVLTLSRWSDRAREHTKRRDVDLPQRIDRVDHSERAAGDEIEREIRAEHDLRVGVHEPANGLKCRLP